MVNELGRRPACPMVVEGVFRKPRAKPMSNLLNAREQVPTNQKVNELPDIFASIPAKPGKGLVAP